MDAATAVDMEKRVFLRADKTIPYGELVRLMDLLRAAGYLKVALVGLGGVDTPSGEVDGPLVASSEPQR